MAQNVTQDQPVIISQLGKVATLNCLYEISRNVHDYWIFWYKQLPSGEMTYLIRQYSEDRKERDGLYSVNFQKECKSINLTISFLKLEHSAKYFCALWEHTVFEVIGKAEQKPSKLDKRKPLCCRTLAEIHTWISQTINGGPVVASSVVWIRRFNSK